MLNCVRCEAQVPDTALDQWCADCWPLMHDDRQVCAWCYPGSKGNSIGSHGICPAHASTMVAEVTEYWITREGDWVEDTPAPVSVGEWERSIGIQDDPMPIRQGPPKHVFIR